MSDELTDDVKRAAELADTYEAWLLEIGRVIGCGHLDEQLVSCVTTELQGDGVLRYMDELDALRKEAAWVRNKLQLPSDSALMDLQGCLHVMCSNAHGFTEYIQSHKCDDKQGEIARLTVHVDRLQQSADRLADALEKLLNTVVGKAVVGEVADAARTALDEYRTPSQEAADRFLDDYQTGGYSHG